MGVSVYYFTIPPSSTLYKRLQNEKALSILMVSLFGYGFGIFRFFELPPGEIYDILQYVIERHQESFGSDLEADLAVAEFRSELRCTRQAYPGIEDRIVSLEKSSLEIEERLLYELDRKQVPNSEKIVQRLMFGDQWLAPTLLPEEQSLGLVSRPLVKEGANILRQINPERLFASDEKEFYYLDHFKQWRNLYLLADEKDEEILIGVLG